MGFWDWLTGSSDDEDEGLKYQKKRDKEARKEEEKRKARIDKGKKAISEAFHGKDVMKNVTKTTKLAGPAKGAKAGAAVSGLPAGYTYVQINDPSGKKTTVANKNYSPALSQTSSRSNDAFGRGSSSKTTTQPAKIWAVQGPDGKIHNIGSNLSYDTSVDTGVNKGGIEDAFYDTFKKDYLGFYMPQLAEQYGGAQSQTNFNLARAGLLQSSGAIDEATRLATQNALNETDITTKADAAVGDLKKQASDAEAAAIAQLTATEDPTAAANLATASVKDITAQKPDSTPLQDVFKLATIGVAGGLQGYANARRMGTIPGASTATRVVT